MIAKEAATKHRHMAKIYETKEDFQRDVIEAQAKDLRLRSERQASSGLALIGLSFIPSVVRVPRWIEFVATVTGIVGAIDVVRSWFTGHKARDLEMHRERMGPGHLVLPAEMAAGLSVVHAPQKHEECSACRHKKMTDALKPKTLGEYADKQADITPVQQR